MKPISVIQKINESDNNLRGKLKSNFPKISEDKINEIMSDVEELRDSLNINNFSVSKEIIIRDYEITVWFYNGDDTGVYTLCYNYNTYGCKLAYQGEVTKKETEVMNEIMDTLGI